MIQMIRERGIVLVTTLLTVVLVVMMVTTVVHSGTAGLTLTTNFHDREVALLAAESGLQYATTRLQAQIGWCGNNPTTTSSTGDLQVAESNGNVIGIMTSKLGQRSMFRIKFNFEDGDNGDDSMPDPASQYAIASPYVSINNITGNVPIPALRANKNGKGRSSAEAPYQVPAGTACIIVEGIAGVGVRDMNIGDADLSPKGYTVTRVVEGYFQIDKSRSADSAAIASGNILANMSDGGTFSLASNEAEAQPRLRSMGNVDVNSNGGNILLNGGKIFYGTNRQDSGHHAAFNNSDIADSESQNSASSFKKLKWEDITKATENDCVLRSGTYAWTLQDGKPVLMYYTSIYPLDQEIPADAKGEIVNTDNIGTIAGTIIVDSDAMGILINNNVYVPDNGIVIRTSEELADVRPTIGFVPAADGNLSSVLTTNGDIQVQGGVMGSGSITTEGSITFQGPSILESDPDTGVSIYAQGDVNLQEITSTVNGAKSVVSYAKREVTADSSSTSASSDQVSMQRENQLVMARGGCGWRDHGSDHDDDEGSRSDGYWSDSGTSYFSGSWSDAVDDIIYWAIQTEQNNMTESGVPGTTTTTTTTIITTPVTPADISINSVDNAVSYADARMIKDLSTYTARKKEQLQKMIDLRSKITYADQDITGVIYTWGNFNVNIGDDSLLNLTGTVIAYGGDPSQDAPGANDKGNIAISSAKDINLTYDPTYIKELLDDNSAVALERTLWTSW